MMAPGHLAHGVLAGLALAPFIPPTNHSWVSIALFVGTSAVGSLVPDLDHPRSRLTRLGGPITWLIHRSLVVLSQSVYSWTRGPRDRIHGASHRTLTHTPVFAMVVGAFLYSALWISGNPVRAYALIVAVGMTIGCLAHLIGDSCTHAGIPWLWPIKIHGQRWRHRGIPGALRFTTGGSIGEPLMTALSMAMCVVVWVFHW